MRVFERSSKTRIVISFASREKAGQAMRSMLACLLCAGKQQASLHGADGATLSSLSCVFVATFEIFTDISR